jgi:predicted CoA-binding protein
MDDRALIEDLLSGIRTIAVVGASRDPAKHAHRVPLALQRMGFRIIPVNPVADELFGEPVHRTLASIKDHVDIVDVFRPSPDTPEIARQAAAMGAPALWLQLGITSVETRRIAEQAGMAFVENHCLLVEASKHPAGGSRTS